MLDLMPFLATSAQQPLNHRHIRSNTFPTDISHIVILTRSIMLNNILSYPGKSPESSRRAIANIKITAWRFQFVSDPKVHSEKILTLNKP